jgi:hypothetical protein
LAHGVFLWNSKLQHVIALSSIKVEYYAPRATIKEALWMRDILEEMNIPQKESLKDEFNF